jgi:hypothetical protein
VFGPLAKQPLVQDPQGFVLARPLGDLFLEPAGLQRRLFPFLADNNPVGDGRAVALPLHRELVVELGQLLLETRALLLDTDNALVVLLQVTPAVPFRADPQ